MTMDIELIVISDPNPITYDGHGQMVHGVAEVVVPIAPERSCSKAQRVAARCPRGISDGDVERWILVDESVIEDRMRAIRDRCRRFVEAPSQPTTAFGLALEILDLSEPEAR